MNIQWSFDLPTSDKNEYFMYESPIYTDNSEVLFTYENRQDMKLLVIDTNTGVGKELSLKSSVRVLSKKYFFVASLKGIVFYAGDLFCYGNGKVDNVCKLRDYGEVFSHLVYNDLLYIICSKAGISTLLCFDLNTLVVKWKCDVTSKPYISGPITIFEI